MPKTAVNKNHNLLFSKHQIRLSRHVLILKRVSKSFFPESFTKKNFWFCVLAPYAGHIITALTGSMDISHDQPETLLPVRDGLLFSALPAIIWAVISAICSAR